MPHAPNDQHGLGDDQSSSVLLLMAETIERLVVTLEQELDPDATEGAEPTGPAWAEVRGKILTCASESRRILDRPDVIAALARGAA
jgi:hypothetical protein